MAASSERRCLYDILGIARDANADDIKIAYRKLALKWHPGALILGLRHPGFLKKVIVLQLD